MATTPDKARRQHKHPFYRSREEVLNRLAHVLGEKGGIAPDVLEEAEHRARWLDKPLDTVLADEGIVSEEYLRDLLSEISGIPVCSTGRLAIDSNVLSLLPPRAVIRYRVMPLDQRGQVMVLLADRVFDPVEEEPLRVLLGSEIEWRICTREEMSECIKHYYGIGVESMLPGDGRGTDGRGGTTPDISGFVHEVLQDAIRCNATDVHFEPSDDSMRIRFRIDGVLYPMPLPEGLDQYRRAIISSIKVSAQLNIAEKRLPQDGRFVSGSGDESFDIRVSVLPTRYGEAVNLRILNRRATFINIDDIGLDNRQRSSLDDLLVLPNGLLLFTGPTGSGKTTSLYAALDHLNDSERKIITLEDPIEYQIPGVSQLQVQEEIGFTFASGLRSVLRHDPDVVLIGEIRDGETARIAVSSAMTGHLVFSTLHTNDSASAATRLIDMGIEPYLVASSVQGIIAQRLLRLLCPECRELLSESGQFEDEIRRLVPDHDGPLEFYRGRGCPSCRFTGYRGRRAIYEIFMMSDDLRPLVVQRVSSAALMERAVVSGLHTLREMGWRCALSGLTTVEEVMRVTRAPTDTRSGGGQGWLSL